MPYEGMKEDTEKRERERESSAGVFSFSLLILYYIFSPSSFFSTLFPLFIPKSVTARLGTSSSVSPLYSFGLVYLCCACAHTCPWWECTSHWSSRQLAHRCQAAGSPTPRFSSEEIIRKRHTCTFLKGVKGAALREAK